MYTRTQTRPVPIGSIVIGGQNRVIIQSMTSTKTKDIDATINQIHSLERAGCELIRVACLDIEDANAIRSIKPKIHIPISADIHFDYRIALAAIEAGADKIRINPGNLGGEEKLQQVVDACKQKKIPIRIGINGGSLERDLEALYGHDSALGIFESAKRNIELVEKMGFHNIVLSLKSSNVLTTIQAYQLAAKNYHYPLHIGITEAGTLLTSAIRSSAGLGVLLSQGIGDTMRISISDDPIKEMQVAKELLRSFNLYSQMASLISCPTCGRIQYDMIPIAKAIEEYLTTINIPLSVAVMGCVVNGPSEAKNADIGIAGGNHEVILFKKGTFIRKINEDEALSELIKEIDQFVEEYHR
jgi:(E)-4-hydroxy-3-methylbut-2-enyl-diphosphate synthase